MSKTSYQKYLWRYVAVVLAIILSNATAYILLTKSRVVDHNISNLRLSYCIALPRRMYIEVTSAHYFEMRNQGESVIQAQRLLDPEGEEKYKITDDLGGHWCLDNAKGTVKVDKVETPVVVYAGKDLRVALLCLSVLVSISMSWFTWTIFFEIKYHRAVKKYEYFSRHEM